MHFIATKNNVHELPAELERAREAVTKASVSVDIGQEARAAKDAEANLNARLLRASARLGTDAAVE